MKALDNKFGEMTEQEEKDYEIGSSNFYNEGATIVCSLDELYGLNEHKDEDVDIKYSK